MGAPCKALRAFFVDKRNIIALFILFINLKGSNNDPHVLSVLLKK